MATRPDVFELSPSPIVMFRPHGTIEHANPAFCRMLGYPAQEVIGRNWWNLLDTQWMEPVIAAVRHLCDCTFESLDFEVRLRGRNGERIWCQAGATLANVESEMLLLLTLTDVTEAAEMQRDLIERVSRLDRQLREDHIRAAVALRDSEERFRGLFEQAPIGMAVADLEGRFVQVNPAFARILGYRVDEILQLGWEELLEGHDAPGAAVYKLVNLAQSVPSQSPALQADARFRCKDGQWIDVQWSLLVVRDSHGQPACQIGQIVDISRRKQDEKKLRHYATVLDQSNRDLQDFAYVASHDLQEPLRMVKSYLELLARRYEGKLDADAGQFISFALDGASRMQQLVAGLLAYARVGTQANEVRIVNAGASLEAALANLHVAIAETGARVSAEPLPRIEADGLLMTQLFQNLISNSIKFRSEEAPKVHIGAKQTKAGWEFSISDNGIGMPQQYASRAFQIFQRLHSQSKYPGAGLGLAICKRIVERHGGDIRVESEPGKGATVFFEIPSRETADVT